MQCDCDSVSSCYVPGVDALIIITLAAAVLAISVAVYAVRNRNSGTTEELARTTERLVEAQAELAGRLSQIADADAASQKALSERLQNQEIAITKTLEERLTDVTKKVGDSLQQSDTKSAETMTKLQERLAVIDAAQKNITELSAQVVQLQDVLSNRHARGAFGGARTAQSGFHFRSLRKTLKNQCKHGPRKSCFLGRPLSVPRYIHSVILVVFGRCDASLIS